jgi:hypothetical protein
MTDEQIVAVAHTPAKYMQRKGLSGVELYSKDSQFYQVDRDTIRCLLDSCIAHGVDLAAVNREGLEKALIQYCADIRNGKANSSPCHHPEGPE